MDLGTRAAFGDGVVDKVADDKPDAKANEQQNGGGCAFRRHRHTLLDVDRLGTLLDLDDVGGGGNRVFESQ